MMMMMMMIVTFNVHSSVLFSHSFLLARMIISMHKKVEGFEEIRTKVHSRSSEVSFV